MVSSHDCLYADVILPFAVRGFFTYALTPEISSQVAPGSLVVVPFGTDREYAGIIRRIHSDSCGLEVVKSLRSVVMAQPVVGELSLGFWEWMSDYYMCFIGEVMKAAFPSYLLRFLPFSARAGSRKKTPSVTPGDMPLPSLNELTPGQMDVLNGIREAFGRVNVALLHGITASGKTEIYFHLMAEQLRLGRQVLYMVPEIALTVSLIDRLRRYFGDSVLVYHSRLTGRRKAEVWQRTGGCDGQPAAGLVLGVRSSVFLPFVNLGLIVVDEEHDQSYKQQDPSPRYNARDAAIMLGAIHKGKVILGSATPSLESYYNASAGKYSLHKLMTRYGDAVLPEISIADTRRAKKRKEMVSYFTPELMKAMDKALATGEQIMLLRNRRGFSPFMQCQTCGWIPLCRNCSVSLTYHKGSGKLKCHYCGYSESIAVTCRKCGGSHMNTVGYGTEKVEEELKILLPDARIDRMDYDTTSRTDGFIKILSRFASHESDILVGTQMISKGLDFENLTVVGILHADSLLSYPDFRSCERAFQMMSQVSGRSGRRNKKGRVIIQTADPDNEIIGMVLKNDFPSMYAMLLAEREQFGYPPFTRLIRIFLRHRNRQSLDDLAAAFAAGLRACPGIRVMGPEYPQVARVRNLHVKSLLVKIDRKAALMKAKQCLAGAAERLQALPGAGSLKIVFDIDPA